MNTETLTKPDLNADVDDGSNYAHWVSKLPGDPRSMRAIIVQAIRNKTPLMALCGYRWVPKTDMPAGIPVCPACKAIAAGM